MAGVAPIMRRRRSSRKPPHGLIGPLPARSPSSSRLSQSAAASWRLWGLSASSPCTAIRMGRLGASLLLLASLAAAAGAIGTSSRPQRLHAEPLGDEPAWNASVSVSLADRKPISPLLFGIFFEEASAVTREGGSRPPPHHRRRRRHLPSICRPLMAPVRPLLMNPCRLGTPARAACTQSLCRTAGLQHRCMWCCCCPCHGQRKAPRRRPPRCLLPHPHACRTPSALLPS